MFYNVSSADVSGRVHPCCRCRLFANDKSIECDSFPDHIADCFSYAQSSLDSIVDWASSAGLHMNVSKCRFVVFGSPCSIRSVGEDLPCLTIYGDVIERVREFKYLGVWVDEFLT